MLQKIKKMKIVSFGDMKNFQKKSHSTDKKIKKGPFSIAPFCMLRLKGTLRANLVVFFRGIRLAENERVTLIVGLFSSKSAY